MPNSRNWHLGEPGWSWPDDVDKTGTETRSAHRYLPVKNTQQYPDHVVKEWEVARVFVDEDDAEMLDDARLIEVAPKLLEACKLLVALEITDVNDADTRWALSRRLMREAIAHVENKT